MHDDTPVQPESQHEPEIAALAVRLDLLSEHDRGEPDEGFEARLAESARPGVLGAIAPERHPLAVPLRWAFAAAACLVVTIGGFLVLRPAPSPTAEHGVTVASIDAEIEGFLFIDDLIRDGTIDDAISAAEVYTSGVIGSGTSGTSDELYLDLLNLEGGSS